MDTLRDGSETTTGKRLAENKDWNNTVLFITACAGTKACKDVIRGMRTVSPEMADKAKVSAVVMVPELRPVTTRKGDRMAVLQLEDLTGSCDAVVFLKSYARLADHLMLDSCLFVWALSLIPISDPTLPY